MGRLLKSANLTLLCAAGALVYSNYFAGNEIRPGPADPVGVKVLPAREAPQPIAVAPYNSLSNLDGFDAYNNNIPLIERVAEEQGVPVKVLATVLLTESRCEGGERYEPAFERRYVVPVLSGSKDSTHKPLRKTLEGMLAGQLVTGVVKDKEEFSAQLATSYGAGQIMYLVAVEQGFRGTAEELGKLDTNSIQVCKRLKRNESKHGFRFPDVFIDYNAGNISGTPHPGYVQRARSYRTKLR